MAIKKSITFEGRKYNLDDRDRVAAESALQLDTETLTDSGAANPGIPISLTSNGAGSDAITLADGKFIGQVKYFIHIDASGTKSEVTPATTAGTYATFDLAAVGDTVTLVWTSVGWAVVGRQSGVANATGAFDGPLFE